MRILRALAVGTFLACAGLACSGLPTDISLPTAEITDPWKGMDLPIGDGNVIYSDSKTITIQYSGTDVEKHKKPYAKAIMKSGAKKQSDNSASGNVVMTFEKGGKMTTMAISSAAGNTMVVLTQA